MMTVLFVTTSDNKLSEAQRVLNRPIERSSIHLVEPQEVELEPVVIAKAQQAFEKLRVPVVVDDSGLFIAAFNGLPGALVRWFLQRVGPEGICEMVNHLPSREAIAQTAVAYHDGQVMVFQGSVKGRISEFPRGNEGFGFDSIFVPASSEKTFGEMSPAEKDHFSMRRLAFEALLSDDKVARSFA
jgi:non-canonical purine NTP pyrophosphatase (RdgB/HAM1 family)